jgi:hypothetical protein
MIEPDHVCSWTRRHRSVLRRVEGSLGGAGIPRAVIQAVAGRLGVAMSSAIDPADEYTELLTIGPWRGTLHDGCFVHLEVDEPAVRAALVEASFELHEAYLGVHVGASALVAATEWLADGAELLLHSIPNLRELHLSTYPASAGAWQRWLAPVTRIKV